MNGMNGMNGIVGPRRSNKPIFWALFGGGGMLSALIGPMLVLVTGLLVPLGLFGPGAMGYDRMAALMHSPLMKLAAVVVVGLFLFHGFHRLYHTLHDFGWHITRGHKALCHGLAALGTLATLLVVAPL